MCSDTLQPQFVHTHTHTLSFPFAQPHSCKGTMNLSEESESRAGEAARGSTPTIPYKVLPGWAGEPHTLLTSIHR